MPTYEYSEKVSNNYIKLFVDEKNIAWIHKYFIDSENYKLFAVMLKNAFLEAASKHNCDKYMQYVAYDDWKYLKDNDLWKIEFDDDNAFVKLISCDIDNAPVCIMSGFLN